MFKTSNIANRKKSKFDEVNDSLVDVSQNISMNHLDKDSVEETSKDNIKTNLKYNVDNRLKSLLNIEKKNIRNKVVKKGSLLYLINFGAQSNLLLLNSNDFNLCEEYMKAISN
jgi:hypothetical protein